MDDFLKMVIEAAMKNEVPAQTVTPLKSEIDFEKKAEKSAKISKALYDAYIKAGFTAEQAFTFTLNIITPKR